MRPKSLLSDSFFPVLLVVLALGFFFSGTTISRDQLEVPPANPTQGTTTTNVSQDELDIDESTTNSASQIEISYSVTTEPAAIGTSLFQAKPLLNAGNPDPSKTPPPFCPEDNLNGTYNECTNSCSGTVKTDGNDTCTIRYNNPSLVCCTTSQKACKVDKSCNWKNNTSGQPNGSNSECSSCGGWCARQGVNDSDPGKCVNATN